MSYLKLGGGVMDGVVKEASKDAEKSSLEEQRHGVMIERNAMQQLRCTVVRVRWVAMKVGKENNARLDNVLMGKPTCHAHVQLTWYDTIQDAILTCARKPTWVSLIYRMEPTTKKCKNRKTKSRKQICSEITVNSPGNPCSKYLRRRKEGLQREGFAEKDRFWAWNERVGDGIPNNSKYDCWQIKVGTCLAVVSRCQPHPWSQSNQNSITRMWNWALQCHYLTEKGLEHQNMDLAESKVSQLKDEIIMWTNCNN